jgi:CDP-paratose 2-epimerase
VKNESNKRMLITGGAGFIGTNCAMSFYKRGWHITIVDNLSRHGTDRNLAWICDHIPVEFHRVDVRDWAALEKVFIGKKFDAVLHLAAQVAVTTSVTAPREDFEINALGTFNVLEAIRNHCPEAHVLYASTNKVYGELDHLKIVKKKGRYEYGSLSKGVPESMPLDFHSPYGCSKGAGDQYVVDYARIYNLKTTVFRQSCIYGPRQFGMEDQGWVAWFMIASLLHRPITLYGDGMQIRDVLHVNDLIELYNQALAHPEKSSGEAFNVGGGHKNTISLLELLTQIKSHLGHHSNYTFADWRPGDQKVYVSDISKAKKILGWSPKLSKAEGVSMLLEWVKDNQGLFQSVWGEAPIAKLPVKKAA